MLALGLKFKPPAAASGTTEFKHSIDSYCSKLRELKIKAYCGELNKELHPVYGRVSRYIYKLHYKDKLAQHLHTAICESFGIPYEAYIRKIQSKMEEITRKCKYKEPPHLRKDRRLLYQAIQRLKQRHDIIIKPTDKNLGIACVSRTEYINAGYAKLNDRNYRKVTECNMEDIARQYINIFQQLGVLQYTLLNRHPIRYTLPLDWKQFRIDKEYEQIIKLGGFYLSNPDFIKLCRFYLTLKVHKNPRGYREICASPSWITAIMALMIHIMLFPILQKTPSYVRQSADVIMNLQEIQNCSEYAFIQADVESMYPSIKIDDGLNALQETLKDNGYNHLKAQLLVKTTEWVLRNNYMTFNDDIYHQIEGTAMGSSLSVTYACLYMALKEQIAIKQFLRTTTHKPVMYKRMVDDVAAIMENRMQALIFMHLLQTTVETGINFEYQINDTSMIFMDMEVYKDIGFNGTNTLSTRLYQKPMNKYLFLPFQSGHPTSVFRSWITCYLQRIRILCSKDEEFEYNKQKFYMRLRRRGYRAKFLRRIFEKEYNREKLLVRYTQAGKKCNKKQAGHIAAIRIPFNRVNQLCLHQLKDVLKIPQELQTDVHFNDIFGKRKVPMTIYKTAKSVSALLIRAEIKANRPPNK